jgi:PAS domain S-box-containing protein
MIFDKHNRPIDWIYLDVNNAFVQLTGLKNIVGKRVTEAIPGIRDNNPELFKIYGNVALAGKSKTFEIFFKSLNVWFKIRAFSPEKEHFVAVFENITERILSERELKESEEKFRTIFAESPIGIELYDDKGLQIQANRASLDMFGIDDLAEVMGFNLFEGTTLTEENNEKLSKGKSVSYFASFDFDRVRELNQYKTTRTGHAELFYVITLLLKLSRKNKSGYLVQVQDITERKIAEDKIRELHTELAACP